MTFKTIGEAAAAVLNTAAPTEKSLISRHYVKRWFAGDLKHEFPCSPPDWPARPVKPEVFTMKDMPKPPKTSQKFNMVALLHAIAHIEFNAIDLAWDITGRFGSSMPKEFTDDWLKVADDESRHFDLMAARLKSYDGAYGDLPAHNGLWQSAKDTAHDLKARLAIVPLVLEARGLDVTPALILRFKNAGDVTSVAALDVIYKEEITHVKIGYKWFHYLCQKEDMNSQETYHYLVRKYFKGPLKAPFNKAARHQAGLDEGYYMPLASRP